MLNGVLGVRFATEVALMVGAVWVGWQVSPVIGVVAGLAVAAIWGVLVAPKSDRRLDDPLRLGVEFALFAVVGIWLVATGHAPAGVALAVVGVGVAVAVRRAAPGS